MADATPVHSAPKKAARKPLSKDAQKIKKELEETPAETPVDDHANTPDVPPGTSKLPDGTIVTDH